MFDRQPPTQFFWATKYTEKVIKARDTQIECARAGTGQTQITNLTADRDLERNIQGQYK